MEKKFNICDRVRSKFYGVVGTIMEIDTDGYILKPDTDDDMWIADTDVEPYDPKTAFLSELKGLLEKYGYSISSGINFGESDTYKAFGGMGFISSDESRDIDYNPKYGCITPDNIMDYEK